MGSPKAPVPGDFREKWLELVNDTALLRHYGGDMSKIRRWRAETGLPSGIQREQCPADFKSVWATGARDVDLSKLYRVSESTIARWRRETGLRRNVWGRKCKVPPETYDQGCRCDKCRAANASEHRQWVARARLRTAMNGGIAPVAKHNYSTYRNWGCRCTDCRRSHYLNCREFKDARKATMERAA